jgi:hypothetical protein
VLRALVLMLALANLGYFAWTQGWLDDVVGMRPGATHEPQRLARQVRPEAVVVLPAAAKARAASDASITPPPPALADSTADSAAASESSCYEAGPFSAAAASAAMAAAQAALPSGSFADVRIDTPGVWLVYMGKFASADGLAKKKEELQRIRLEAQDVRDAPALEPGLALGRYDSRAAADKALAQFALRGVRSARVVELSAPSTTHLVRVAQADAALAAQLLTLRADGLGQGFTVCVERPTTN